MIRSIILASGSYLPEKIISNDKLSELVDTNDEWIRSRTGIHKRHIAGDNETTSDMAYEACKSALRNASVGAEEIDMLIVATTSPDLSFPSCAVLTAAKLGLKCPAFDVQAVCAGFVYAMAVADKFLKSGEMSKILVVGAEKMSSLVNWTDRSTCVLFGDGAGAIILASSNDGNRGIIGCSLNSDGSCKDILLTSGGIGTNKKTGEILMNGREVFRHAVEKMSSSIQELLEINGLSVEDINYVVPHQANERIIDAIAKRMNIDTNKFIKTVDIHANTSAASIPLAIDQGLGKKALRYGDLIAMTAIGGGLAWGAALLKW